MESAGLDTTEDRPSREGARAFDVVAWIAAAVAVPFALSHLTLGTVAREISLMSAQMGGELPWPTSWLLPAASSGLLGVALLAVDAAIFYLMWRLAKRYWIGLLFAPVFAYMAINAIFVPLLYLPMFSVIQQVQ